MKKPSGPARPFDAQFFGILTTPVKPRVVQKKRVGPRFGTIRPKLAIVHSEEEVAPSAPVKNVFSASQVDRIQWKELEEPRKLYLRWKRACNIVRRRRLIHDSHFFSSLYVKFLDHLELTAREELITTGRRRALVLSKLRHLATGKIEGKEELGDFIKFTLLGKRMVLPKSFFNDFNSVIVDLSAREHIP